MYAQSERLSASGSELVFRLPLSASSSFPALLGDLDTEGRRIGIMNFGASSAWLLRQFTPSSARTQVCR